jgi:hypothetical protein
LVIGLVNHERLLGSTANNQSYKLGHVDTLYLLQASMRSGLCLYKHLHRQHCSSAPAARFCFDADKLSLPTKKTIPGDNRRALLLFSLCLTSQNKKHKITRHDTAVSCWDNVFHYTDSLSVDSLFPRDQQPWVKLPTMSR